MKICSICGGMHFGTAPDRCPIEEADPDRQREDKIEKARLEKNHETP